MGIAEHTRNPRISETMNDNATTEGRSVPADRQMFTYGNMRNFSYSSRDNFH